MTEKALIDLAVLFGISCAASLAAVPLFRGLARRIGLVDAPDGRRKHQSKPIPRSGGLAILSVVLTILALAGLFRDSLPTLETSFSRHWLLPLLCGTLLIGVVGFLDDWKGLRGRHKLLGQILAISVMILPGQLSVQHINVLGWTYDLGFVFGILFTYCWMLGAINALNLIDGMDGLLGSIAFMVCCVFTGIAIINANVYVALVSVTMAGAIVGFLRYNLPPASVYLGDCGSMSLGYLLGALAIQGSVKGAAAVSIGIPIAILILPIFDTTAAIIRRKLTGRSIYTTDRGHLHHCLQRSGLSRRRVLFLVGGFMLVLGAGALASTYLHNEVYAYLAAAAVVACLTLTRMFGNAELNLLKERARGKLTIALYGRRTDEHNVEVRLQGSAGWNEVWRDLTDAARAMNLQTLWLDVNAPSLHESYHARWDRFGAHQENPSHWKAEIPLFYDGQAIGRLTAVGQPDAEPMWEKLAMLATMVERTERGLTTVTRQHVASTLKVAPLPAAAVSLA